jgi:crotonobetainyl-CoA:carnitine CoA-transferase CaiB-like acyl-CoA transferase
MGSEHPNIVPYGSILRARDGREVVIGAATERQYRELVRAIDLPYLADDPAYATTQLRVARRHELLAQIRARAAELTAAELAIRLEDAKVPYGFVNDMAAVFAQPAAARLVLEGERDGRSLRGVRTLALGGDAMRLATPAPPPHLDQDRAEILTGFLGLDSVAIENLAMRGAFGVDATDRQI